MHKCLGLQWDMEADTLSNPAIKANCLTVSSKPQVLSKLSHVLSCPLSSKQRSSCRTFVNFMLNGTIAFRMTCNNDGCRLPLIWMLLPRQHLLVSLVSTQPTLCTTSLSSFVTRSSTLMLLLLPTCKLHQATSLLQTLCSASLELLPSKLRSSLVSRSWPPSWNTR